MLADEGLRIGAEAEYARDEGAGAACFHHKGGGVKKRRIDRAAKPGLNLLRRRPRLIHEGIVEERAEARARAGGGGIITSEAVNHNLFIDVGNAVICIIGIGRVGGRREFINWEERDGREGRGSPQLPAPRSSHAPGRSRKTVIERIAGVHHHPRDQNSLCLKPRYRRDSGRGDRKTAVASDGAMTALDGKALNARKGGQPLMVPWGGREVEVHQKSCWIADWSRLSRVGTGWGPEPTQRESPSDKNRKSKLKPIVSFLVSMGKELNVHLDPSQFSSHDLSTSCLKWEPFLKLGSRFSTPKVRALMSRRSAGRRSRITLLNSSILK